MQGCYVLLHCTLYIQQNAMHSARCARMENGLLLREYTVLSNRGDPSQWCSTLMRSKADGMNASQAMTMTMICKNSRCNCAVESNHVT